MGSGVKWKEVVDPWLILWKCFRTLMGYGISNELVCLVYRL